MAGDGLFFKTAASIHPRFGTPASAIALQAALASLLITIRDLPANHRLFHFRHRDIYRIDCRGAVRVSLEGKNSAYEAPGYPATPLLFLSLVVVLLVLIAGHDPKQALLGVGVVALGLPVYELVFANGDDRELHSPQSHGNASSANRGTRMLVLSYEMDCEIYSRYHPFASEPQVQTLQLWR
jgi:hypothetical protein